MLTALFWCCGKFCFWIFVFLFPFCYLSLILLYYASLDVSECPEMSFSVSFCLIPSHLLLRHSCSNRAGVRSESHTSSYADMLFIKNSAGLIKTKLKSYHKKLPINKDLGEYSFRCMQPVFRLIPDDGMRAVYDFICDFFVAMCR